MAAVKVCGTSGAHSLERAELPLDGLLKRLAQLVVFVLLLLNLLLLSNDDIVECSHFTYGCCKLLILVITLVQKCTNLRSFERMRHL